MTPGQVAAEFGVSANLVRTWLRQSFPRTPTEANRRWELAPREVDAARAHFKLHNSTTTLAEGQQPGRRAATDVELFQQCRERFASAPIFTRDDVLRSPCPVPPQPGIYGWWFRQLPARFDTERCVVRAGSTLLYVGISPRRPPVNGAGPSRQTLRDRIKYHHKGNAEGSTLRKTLGSLLSAELHLDLRRVGSGKRMTFVDGEKVLSAWMAQNAGVSWLVDPTPWILEAHLIAELDTPLNIDGNKHNPVYAQLTAARSRAVARARQLPVLPNPGTGGR